MNKNPNKTGEMTGVNELEASKSEKSREALAENSQNVVANTAAPEPPTNVRLTRASGVPSPGDLGDEKIFWTAIRNRTEAIGFDNYAKVIDAVLCCRENSNGDSANGSVQELVDVFTGIGTPSIKERRDDLLEDYPSIYGVDTYNLLKLTTQAFLLFNTGIVIRRLHKGNDPFLEEERIRYGDDSIIY